MNVDVAICGASVAGATLAHLLGRAGAKVALIDKAHFPRRKPCGEGISPLGVELLDRLSLLPALLACSHARFSGYRVWFGERSIALSSLPTVRSGNTQSLALERQVLDETLNRHAVLHPSVTAVYGEHVRAVHEEERGVILSLDRSEISARFCVLADGGSSVLAERLGVKAHRSSPLRYGMSLIAEGSFISPLSEVHLEQRGEYELFFTQVAPNRLNIAVLGSGAQIEQLRGESQALLKSASGRVGFTGTVVCPPQAIGPVSSAQRHAAKGRVLLIGDACEVFDPISGMGMTHALLSALLASTPLLKGVEELWSPLQVAHSYSQQRESQVRALRGTTYLVSSLIHQHHSETLLRFLAPVLNTRLSHPALKTAAHVTGRALRPNGHAAAMV